MPPLPPPNPPTPPNRRLQDRTPAPSRYAEDHDPRLHRPILAAPGDPDRPVLRGPLRDPGNGMTRVAALLGAFVMVVTVVAMQFAGRNGPPIEPTSEIAGPDLQMLLTGRLAMGMKAVEIRAAPSSAQAVAANERQLMGQIDDLARGGPVRDDVRAAIISAEFDGPQTALERLAASSDALDEVALRATNDAAPDDAAAEAELERVEALRSDIAALRSIYGAGGVDAAALSDDQRQGLVDRHGYFGEIALSYGLDPASAARRAVLNAGMRTIVTLVAAAAVVCLALLAGFVLFVVALVKMLSRGGIQRRYAPPAFGGSVYLETFTLFLVGFVVVSLLAGVLGQFTNFPVEYALVWLLLIVPFWPVVRGQRWILHKHALGWTRGRGFANEIFSGIVGYLALLPVFLFGVLCTLLLSVLIGIVEQWLGHEPPGPMTHPIMEQLGGGDLKTLLLLLSLAAVWAPLVEETVFRGAFFHHLRGRWGVLGSALLAGFVFAVIHPQGFAAVPALMSLGFSFALLREWRGSLIAPITAHAMHNGFLVTTLWLALS